MTFDDNCPKKNKQANKQKKAEFPSSSVLRCFIGHFKFKFHKLHIYIKKECTKVNK